MIESPIYLVTSMYESGTEWFQLILKCRYSKYPVVTVLFSIALLSFTLPTWISVGSVLCFVGTWFIHWNQTVNHGLYYKVIPNLHWLVKVILIKSVHEHSEHWTLSWKGHPQHWPWWWGDYSLTRETVFIGATNYGWRRKSMTSVQNKQTRVIMSGLWQTC